MKITGDIVTEGYQRCDCYPEDIELATAHLERTGWDLEYGIQTFIDKHPEISARELAYGWLKLFLILIHNHQNP